jgi:hypothetical protein
MLTLLTFKWAKPGYRSKFTGENVNTLARMVKRNYAQPHRFVCYTDDPTGIDPSLVDARELWNDHSQLVNPSAPSHGPSCYRRLKMFARDAGEWLGPRICAMDLDVVVTGDLTRVFNRPEDFVIWGDTSPPTPYNGSLVLFTAGCRPQLWEDFDPVESPIKTRKLGYFGSDQAWIGACLGPLEAKFGRGDGVYSFRNHIQRHNAPLPQNARLVIFHGAVDPWSDQAQRIDWARKNYR